MENNYTYIFSMLWISKFDTNIWNEEILRFRLKRRFLITHTSKRFHAIVEFRVSLKAESSFWKRAKALCVYFFILFSVFSIESSFARVASNLSRKNVNVNVKLSVGRRSKLTRPKLRPQPRTQKRSESWMPALANLLVAVESY